MRSFLGSVVAVVLGSSCGGPAESAEPFTMDCSLSAQAFLQGAIVDAQLPTELALDGAGFFVVADERGTAFTRDGRFRLADDGTFVHVRSGARLQKVGGGNLTLGNGVLGASPTSKITIIANVNASATPRVFELADPASTSDGAAHLVLYDALGGEYPLDVYWVKDALSAWAFYAVTDGARLANGTPGQRQVISQGTLTFNSQGMLLEVTQESNFWPESSPSVQPLTFDFGHGVSGVTMARRRSPSRARTALPWASRRPSGSTAAETCSRATRTE